MPFLKTSFAVLAVVSALLIVPATDTFASAKSTKAAAIAHVGTAKAKPTAKAPAKKTTTVSAKKPAAKNSKTAKTPVKAAHKTTTAKHA